MCHFRDEPSIKQQLQSVLSSLSFLSTLKSNLAAETMDCTSVTHRTSMTYCTHVTRLRRTPAAAICPLRSRSKGGGRGADCRSPLSSRHHKNWNRPLASRGRIKERDTGGVFKIPSDQVGILCKLLPSPLPQIGADLKRQHAVGLQGTVWKSMA